jgi:hypothetical protein
MAHLALVAPSLLQYVEGFERYRLVSSVEKPLR